MGWNPEHWTWIEHLAVWPLATLIIGIVAGFAWLTITDPTLPDDGSGEPQKVEAGTHDAPRHRA